MTNQYCVLATLVPAAPRSLFFASLRHRTTSLAAPAMLIARKLHRIVNIWRSSVLVIPPPLLPSNDDRSGNAAQAREITQGLRTKYQKIVEASHNKGSGLKGVQNCIRSDNFVITFEVEEEKFPFFGKKYMLKFANDIISETHCLVHFPSLIRLAREAGLDYVEIQNLAEFYDDNRAQFAGMLCSYGANFLDPRGKLVARSFDILGLYSIFVFQKSDPDAAPPILTPVMQDEEHQDWLGNGWRQQAATGEDEKNVQPEPNSSHGCVLVPQEKGILGPGPADLRFSEPL